jgi:hypothetical protein
MKFYDNNGKTHSTMFHAIISNLSTRSNKVEVVLATEPSDVKLESGKTIKIDYDNNKILLMDNSDQVILESELHPRLGLGVFITNNIDAIDPKLNDPDFIDKIINSDRIKESIKRIDSIKINHNKPLTDEQLFSEAKSLSVEAIDVAMQNPNSDNEKSTVKKVIDKILINLNLK